MKIAVIGTGYVGLVTGVSLAQLGHEVVCVDNNEEKVQSLLDGNCPIYEPELEALMWSNKDRICYTTHLENAVNFADVIYIAVGTPSLPTGETDTTYLESVAEGLEACLPFKSYKVIVNKSTVPIGTGNWIKMLIGTGDYDVVSNPEFLREGSAVYDTFNPDRIVLGSDSQKALNIMREVYKPLVKKCRCPIIATDITSAEMIKYAANAFLATKISFINEVANICDRVGADINEVAKGIGADSRIGNKFLQAGLGWGGSCFPKDVAALIHTARDYGYSPRILEEVTTLNDKQKLLPVKKLQSYLGVLKGKTIGLLGLTFKPNTDDMRDAPSIIIAKELKRLGANVLGYDPVIKQDLEDLTVTESIEEVLESSDAVVLVTEWTEIIKYDYFQTEFNGLFVDGRNALHSLKDKMADKGITYVGI